MTRVYTFMREGDIGQSKLTNQPRAKGYRLDIIPFCSDYDKACCSFRVATLSNRAASTTGVSVGHLNTTNVDNTGRDDGCC